MGVWRLWGCSERLEWTDISPYGAVCTAPSQATGGQPSPGPTRRGNAAVPLSPTRTPGYYRSPQRSCRNLSAEILRFASLVPVENCLPAEDPDLQAQAQCGRGLDLGYFLQAQHRAGARGATAAI